MIVVCELLPSGQVKQYDYTKPPGPEVPPWGSPLEWALRIAGLALRDLRHPSWIELREQPASRPTIEKANKSLLRNPFTPPTVH